VLLSVAVQFDIPRTVLVGCMEVLCDGELKREECRDIADIPPFVKTALVWKLLQGLRGADGEGMNNVAYSIYSGEEVRNEERGVERSYERKLLVVWVGMAVRCFCCHFIPVRFRPFSPYSPSLPLFTAPNSTPACGEHSDGGNAPRKQGKHGLQRQTQRPVQARCEAPAEESILPNGDSGKAGECGATEALRRNGGASQPGRFGEEGPRDPRWGGSSDVQT